MHDFLTSKENVILHIVMLTLEKKTTYVSALTVSPDGVPNYVLSLNMEFCLFLIIYLNWQANDQMNY